MYNTDIQLHPVRLELDLNIIGKGRLMMKSIFTSLIFDIVVTKGNELEFYTNDNVTEAFEFDSLKLKAIVYNEVHDMVVYVDKQNSGDRICGHYVADREYQCFIEENGRDIRGLAFDPATELLFFTDANERSINWISFKSGSNNNICGNLLIKTGDAIPTGIAVDSCRGYVYWINTNLPTPSIERARFNGSEREEAYNHKLGLHSLVIDQLTQKLYVMSPGNSTLHHVWYTDLKLIDNFTDVYSIKVTANNPPLNTLTVSKNILYYVDWCTNNCESLFLWKLPKNSNNLPDFDYIWLGDDTTINGIAANYNIKDNYQYIEDCEPLTKYVQNSSDEPSCLHGESVCECSTGYTGERCDVPV